MAERKRKRLGRPARVDRATIRDQRIASAYTADERAELENLAHEARVSMAEYIRRLVVAHLNRVRRKQSK